MTRPKIRVATKKDVSQICKIAEKVHDMVSQHRSNFWGEDVEFCRVQDFYLQILREEDSVIFVSEIEEGKVVGYVYATIEKKPDDLISVPYASVNELAVEEKHRRRGIGKLLMDRVHDWTREQGLNILQLAVWEFNRGAVEFYEHLGYKTIMRKMEKVLQ